MPPLEPDEEMPAWCGLFWKKASNEIGFGEIMTKMELERLVGKLPEVKTSLLFKYFQNFINLAGRHRGMHASERKGGVGTVHRDFSSAYHQMTQAMRISAYQSGTR